MKNLHLLSVILTTIHFNESFISNTGTQFINIIILIFYIIFNIGIPIAILYLLYKIYKKIEDL